MSTWEADGQRRRKLEVIVDNIIGMTNYRQPQQPQAQQQAYVPDVCDEDIPF